MQERRTRYIRVARRKLRGKLVGKAFKGISFVEERQVVFLDVLCMRGDISLSFISIIVRYVIN